MSAKQKERSDTENPRGTIAEPLANQPPTPIKFYGGYQVYSESGVDLTQLRENLKRSIDQRWESNCRMLRLISETQVRNSSAARNGGTALLNMPGILGLLNTGQVEFVVIGGLAMISQGSAYITKDVDLCYARSNKNIMALAACCASIRPYLRGAPPDLPFKFDAATIQAGLNFTLTTDLGDIDFLGEVSGIGTYEKVLAMSEEKEIYGQKLRVLSLEGLIVAKKAAGRTKDKLHLLELEELKKMRDEGVGS
jgi:hypothetical protein